MEINNVKMLPASFHCQKTTKAQTLIERTRIQPSCSKHQKPHFHRKHLPLHTFIFSWSTIDTQDKQTTLCKILDTALDLLLTDQEYHFFLCLPNFCSTPK